MLIGQLRGDYTSMFISVSVTVVDSFWANEGVTEVNIHHYSPPPQWMILLSNISILQ